MASLHHLEVVVKDGLRFVNQLCHQYGLVLTSTRDTATARQWVLASRQTIFLVTEPNSSYSRVFASENPGLHLQFSKHQQGIDSFFDVAIRVKDIDAVLQNITKLGGEILSPKTTITDEFGWCETAMVKSGVGNVVHTLVNRGTYQGRFLPGFEIISDVVPDQQPPAIRHVDHMTLVCERGKMDHVLRWYETVFGFSRSSVNRSDTESDGFVLDGAIGLRLKAMEYFHCAETMLSSDLNAEDGLKLVVAESLPGHDATTNQVELFIKEHDGPGVQHIGLYTDDIILTAQQLRERGVELQIPPALYYSHGGKVAEITASGESVARLRENGVLLDCEADLSTTENTTKKYLKQIFTRPIFDKKTFFMELIERKGALGFGAGNIAALWWSVQQSIMLPIIET